MIGIDRFNGHPKPVFIIAYKVTGEVKPEKERVMKMPAAWPGERQGRATMMDEELHLQPVATTDIMRSAALITLATLIGHLIPLLPFAWLPRTTALITAFVLSAAVLFGVGAYSALTLVGDWRKKGLQMLVIGLGAAAFGFLIARLFHGAGS